MKTVIKEDVKSLILGAFIGFMAAFFIGLTEGVFESNFSYVLKESYHFGLILGTPIGAIFGLLFHGVKKDPWI